jgi:hypothetical protein
LNLVAVFFRVTHFQPPEISFFGTNRHSGLSGGDGFRRRDRRPRKQLKKWWSSGRLGSKYIYYKPPVVAHVCKKKCIDVRHARPKKKKWSNPTSKTKCLFEKIKNCFGPFAPLIPRPGRCGN